MHISCMLFPQTGSYTLHCSLLSFTFSRLMHDILTHYFNNCVFSHSLYECETISLLINNQVICKVFFFFFLLLTILQYTSYVMSLMYCSGVSFLQESSVSCFHISIQKRKKPDKDADLKYYGQKSWDYLERKCTSILNALN